MKTVRIADQTRPHSTITVSSGSRREGRGPPSGGSVSIHSPTSSGGNSFSSYELVSDDEIDPSDSASRSRHPVSRRRTTEVRPAPQRRHSSRRVVGRVDEQEESPPPIRRRATHTATRHRRAESRRTPSDESASVASYDDHPFGHHGAPQPPRAPQYPSGYRHVPAQSHGGYPPSLNSAQYPDPGQYASQHALVHMQPPQAPDAFGYQPNPFTPQGPQPNPFSPLSSAGGNSYFPEGHGPPPSLIHRPGPAQRPQSFVAPSHYGSEMAVSPYQYPPHPGMGMPPYGYGPMSWPYPPPQQPMSQTSSPAPPPVNPELDALRAQLAEENDKLKADLQSKDVAEKAKAAEDLEKLRKTVKKFEEMQAAAEAAAIAKAAEEAAEKKKKAEIAEAEKKAKEGAEKKAEEAMKKAKEEHEKVLAEVKKKQEEAEKKHKELEEEAKKNAPLPDSDKAPIKFKDAVQRTFSFPWHLCKTWKGMETLIRQAFLHIDGIGEHVMQGHYDLQGPDGEIILPQVWETVVKPDWTISMHMWPLPEKEEPPMRDDIYYRQQDPLADLFEDLVLDKKGRPIKQERKGDRKRDKKATSPIIDIPPPPPHRGGGGHGMPPAPNFPSGISGGYGALDPLGDYPGLDPIIQVPERRSGKSSSKTKGSKDISPLTAWMIGTSGSRSSKKDDEKLEPLVVRRRSTGGSGSGGSHQQKAEQSVACAVM
ncbi:hypothetical protein LTR62_000642 [Meristemomyces frigidus]|uniref:Ubiquitin-like domain-containing protein n=1 Tax=Meristemomyces frigidus TaxID=1508187 RepID=A0AAN7TA63_9PEZI|nr:hypothetical protein LTR62_000642 [Meristemomyces frigidus]